MVLYNVSTVLALTFREMCTFSVIQDIGNYRNLSSINHLQGLISPRRSLGWHFAGQFWFLPVACSFGILIVYLSVSFENYFLCCASLCLSPHFILPLCGSDEKIALLGAIQSLFEGSMYTFVFLWTPALSPNDEEIPHGFIFATFMLASMLGSSLASRLMARSSARVESYMQIVFAISAASLLLPIVSSVCHFFCSYLFDI